MARHAWIAAGARGYGSCDGYPTGTRHLEECAACGATRSTYVHASDRREVRITDVTGQPADCYCDRGTLQAEVAAADAAADAADAAAAAREETLRPYREQIRAARDRQERIESEYAYLCAGDEDTAQDRERYLRRRGLAIRDVEATLATLVLAKEACGRARA